MTDYIKKASEGNYEEYVEFLSKLVEDEIDNKKIPLREAAEAIVSDAFYQLRGEQESLDKLMLKANEVLDPPCRDDESWKIIRLMRLSRRSAVIKYTCHRRPEHYQDRTGLDMREQLHKVAFWGLHSYPLRSIFI